MRPAVGQVAIAARPARTAKRSSNPAVADDQDAGAVDVQQEAICVSTPSARRCMERKSKNVDAASMMSSKPRLVSVSRRNC